MAARTAATGDRVQAHPAITRQVMVGADAATVAEDALRAVVDTSAVGVADIRVVEAEAIPVAAQDTLAAAIAKREILTGNWQVDVTQVKKTEAERACQVARPFFHWVICNFAIL